MVPAPLRRCFDLATPTVASLAAAIARGQGLVAVTGEAGVGKIRLIREGLLDERFFGTVSCAPWCRWVRCWVLHVRQHTLTRTPQSGSGRCDRYCAAGLAVQMPPQPEPLHDATAELIARRCAPRLSCCGR